MELLFFLLIGLIAGIAGGMGMGGGTFLIPLLCVFMQVEQLTAQSVNLFVFIPASVAAIIVCNKNGLLEKRGLLWIILPALLSAVGGSYLATQLNERLLKILFSTFLMGTGVSFLIINVVTNKKNSTQKQSN